MYKNLRNSRGFTLAEVMIVLTVIGVLTAILLPVARQSMPDKDLMKFKKAHNTLGTVIRELVTSGEYYLEGDLTTRPDNTLVDGTHEGDNQYLCQTIADVLNVKKVDCKDVQGGPGYFGEAHITPATAGATVEAAGRKFDANCKEAQNTVGAEIITSNNIILYDCNPITPFGISLKNYDLILNGTGNTSNDLYFKLAINWSSAWANKPIGNLHKQYKTICLDIDGLNKGEDPFGYGLRFDGKIQPGARALEWLDKEIQGEE